MRRGVVALGVVAAIALAGAEDAAAHPLDLAYLRVTSTGDSATVVIDLDIDAAARLLAVDGATIDDTALRTRATELAAASYASAPIVTSAGPCTWGTATGKRVARTVTITSTAQCPAAGARTWQFPFVAQQRVSAAFELMVRETNGAGEKLTLVDKSNASLAMTVARQSLGFRSAVAAGVRRTGLAPSAWSAPGSALPAGLAQLALLVTLLVVGGTVAQLATIAAGFALGHAVTLVLAALGVVLPPVSVVGPLAVATVAIAALVAITGRGTRHRAVLAAGLGLVHGFALAPALLVVEHGSTPSGTALVGYLVGLELGFGMLVLLLIGPIRALHRESSLARIVPRVVAALMLGLAVLQLAT